MSRVRRAAAGGLGLVVVAVGADVAAGGLLAQLDSPVLRAAVALRTPVLTTAVRAVTDAGAWPARLVVGAAVAATVALRVRRWAPVGWTALALAAAPAASAGLKRVVGRERPPRALAVITPDDPSFPSGHATGSAALAVVAAGLVCGVARSRAQRTAAVLVAVAYAGAVGASRVYLGAHWLTDVLAGEALGAAIGLLVLEVPVDRPPPPGVNPC